MFFSVKFAERSTFYKWVSYQWNLIKLAEPICVSENNLNADEALSSDIAALTMVLI